MFKEIFGNSPQTKILDFLADHPNYDYNVSVQIFLNIRR